MRIFALWLSVVALVFLAVAPAMAAALDELPAGHWSYAEINALMQRGLVQGYAAGPYVGPVPMTRAEMAAMVARAVRGLGMAVQSQGRRLEAVAQVPAQNAPAETPPTVTPAQPAPSATPQPGVPVTQEDLARIEKLLAEFRAELVTMGANADKIAAEVADLRKMVGETRQQVDQVSQEMTKHRISGYAQIRYTIDGSATPQSQFLVRRAKVALSGPLAKHSSYKVELDVPTQSKAGESSVILNQGYAALDFRRVQMLAGQFYVPFGWEQFTPNRDLEAPEEALAVKKLFPDQKYDRGVRFEGDLGNRWRAWAAVINGTGFRRGDTNDRKDVALRIARVQKSLEYGVSAYLGKDTQLASGATPRVDAKRNLIGGHVLFTPGRYELKGEAIAGKAATDTISAGAKDALSWTVLGAYLPRRDAFLGVRFHHFDPDRDAANNTTDVTSLIAMRWLNAAVRLRLAEEFVRPQASRSYNIFTTELEIVY